MGGSPLFRGRTYYCQKGCAYMKGHYNSEWIDQYCPMKPEERYGSCLRSCKGASSNASDKAACRYACEYWQCESTKVNACFDRCQDEYGSPLFRGRTYYCQKGCAYMKGHYNSEWI